MFEMSILSLLIFLPILSVLVILGMKGGNKSVATNIKYIIVLTSFMHLILSFYLWINFDKILSGYQFTESIILVPSLNIGYSLGIDGISLLFVLFSSLLFFFVILFVPLPKSNVKIYAISLLVMMSASVGTFVATDIVMFYIFYELSIIPVFFIMGVFGEGNKFYATFKFFLYTVFGSIFMIIAIVAMVSVTKDASIVGISSFVFSEGYQKYLFLGMFIAFAVKVALFPFHTWLPDTYESSPFYMNILLSGILMKYGVYGFIKLVIPLFPLAVVKYLSVVYVMCAITIIYSGLIALKSTNIKRIFAYFSISHVALIVAGIFSANIQGVEGAIFQGISHSIYNLGIFLSFIYLEHRFKASNVDVFSGLSAVMPKFAILFTIFSLAIMSFPLTNGFIGEVLILLGIFENNRLFSLLFSSSIIISAIIMINFNKKFIFSETSEASKLFYDVKPMEFISLALVAAIIIVMGIYPDIFLDVIHTSVAGILDKFRSGIIVKI